MVNFLTALNSILRLLLKFYGLKSRSIQIEPGTVIHLWAPEINPLSRKPVLLLVHGFGATAVLMWIFQIAAFSSEYTVVVPELLFFGGSATTWPHRSPVFQARCLARALAVIGVEECAAAIGCSYGGVVLKEMAAEAETAAMVRRLVLSNSNVAMTTSESQAVFERLGVRSWSELILPETVLGLKRLLAASIYRYLWFPDWAYKHYLEVMFESRKEKAELLKELVIKDEDFVIPDFSQKVYIIAGEEDQLFNIETVRKTKAELGNKATLFSIPKAGHLVQMERPFLYNRLLKTILEAPL